MTLNDLAREINNNAHIHGWWDIPNKTFGDTISNCHAELSEAWEEHRNNRDLYYLSEDGKPEGKAVEMLDCVIRIFDYLAEVGVDIDGTIREKMRYNETRPYRHGGKVI